MTLQRLDRAALDYAGLTRVLKEESGDAPYVPGEVRLTELLSENAAELADQVEAPILAAMSGTYVDEQRITAAMLTAGAVWQAAHWPDGLNNEVRETLSATALIGQHDIPFGPALQDVDRLRIVNGMAASAKYYTNRYFNQHVMPAIVDAAHAAVLDGLANDGAQLTAMHALLDRRLRSVPYWNLVANSAASRAYHFGYIKVGVAYGYSTLMYQATIDTKTSEVCRGLNGTRWRAGDVSLFADRIAQAQGDAIKDVAPWVKPSDIAGLDPSALLARGVCIPPLHGRCRSRLVFVAA